MELKTIFSSVLGAVLLSQVAMVQAAPEKEADLQPLVQSILAKFGVSGIEATIADSTVGGLREIVVDGEIFYLTEDNKHIVIGNLMSIENGLLDLTERSRGKMRVKELATLSDDELIIFGDDDAKHTLTVFTDVNCGFCSVFHQKMDELNTAGVRIKYVFMPVIKPSSYEDAKSVWCAEDRNEAMTLAKAGESLPKGTCETPIDKHKQIGTTLGINSTPSMFLENGTKLEINWTRMTGVQIAAALDALKAHSGQ